MTRKILCLILSLSMILSLAACSKQSEKPVAADPGESVPEPLETSLPVSPLPEEEKTVITLATAYMDGPLYTMIRQFNEQSPDCRVETRVYEFGSWDKLRVEIMAGQGPDMIDTVSLALGGEQSLYLEDLLPFLERDPELSADDFIPAVLEAMTEDGKLYTLTPSFFLSAVLDYDGAAQSGLSFEEYERALGPAPDVDDIFPVPSAMQNFREAFPVIENDVVNGNDVDTAVLRGWLQFCKDAPSLGVRHEEIGACGRLPAIRTYISGDAELVGWPAQKSRGFYVMQGAGFFNTGMLADSTHKEEAWRFMRYALFAYYGDIFGRDAPGGFDDFPVLKDLFEAHLQKGLEDQDYPITEQDAQRLREIVYGIDVPSFKHEGLLTVLLPLAEAYFSGQRNLDETVTQMESKIRLYVAEHG